jgi:aryl-alcohol dehydrogenase-like predicted oxidoreductase
MPTPDAALSGTFAIGGALTVHRLGFGAMRITGPGIWGPPTDLAEARRTLRRVPELGVNFIDTAESYGPYVSEELIGQELAPYEGGIVVATKGGFARTGPNAWKQLGRPEFLRQGLMLSLRRLKLDQIPLWQLHRIDPRVPRDEQFGAIAEFLSEGLIRFAGLSEVSMDDIEAAQKFFPVATVQNIYNIGNRKHEAVLDYCAARGIGFIPWAPIAAGNLRIADALAQAAQKYQATPNQIALAWALKRSPVMLPIPGTSKVAHLEENTLAAGIALSDEDFATLNRLGL